MYRYAIVGPPNVGKSTLFYALTGVFVKTANYPGTTVEIHRGVSKNRQFEVVDLPGVLDIERPVDEDERVAIEEVKKGDYDGVIVVAAPHAVEEALRIAKFVSRYRPTVVVFNMADIWRPPLGEEELSKYLSAPVVYVSAARGSGVDKLVKLLSAGVPKSVVADYKLEPPLYASAVGRLAANRPLAAAAMAALGVVTALLLMALIEGVTPLGQLPVSLVSLIDEVDGVVRGLIGAYATGVLYSFIADALWESAVVLMTISLYVFVALALVTLYEDSGLIGALSRGVGGMLAAVGVPPRGVVCLLAGASCNVPAVGSAKVLWGYGNRVLTALLVPYMPCVARLAIFTAVAAAALAQWPYLIPLAVLIPYFISFIAALAASFIYRRAAGIERAALARAPPPAPILLPAPKIFIKKVAAGFVEFFKRVAPLLVIFLIALWPLKAFGPGGFVEDVAESYLAAAGRAVEPVFAWAGLPWEITAPLVAGWIFKEVVLGLLEATGGLEAFSALSLSSTMAFLIFVAFYSACVATLASLYRAVGLRLTALSVGVNLSLAFVFSYIVYNILAAFGL